MSFLPGWDSIESTEAIAHGLHITAIIVLGLLVVSEAAALIYDSRNHRLAGIAESARIAADQKKYDDSEARRKAEVAELQKQVAEADKKAAAAQKQQTQRRLSPEQQETLVKVLSPFKGQKVDIVSLWGDTETTIFRGDFVAVLDRAGWDHNGPHGVSQAVIEPIPVGVQVTINDGEARANLILKSAAALLDVLVQLGIAESKEGFIGPQVPPGTIKLVVGSKARP